MTVVRISETYDLSTQTNKMGFVAIHTPSMGAIMRQWSGLAANHKYVKLLGCDVTMACASMLPADPLQIGTEAGDIAPQDMFNPILYKAVSNDSFSNLLQLMRDNGVVPDVIGKEAGFDGGPGSIASANDLAFTGVAAEGDDPPTVDQFQMYYGLLANSDGWRKTMPQAGLQMKGLFPIVFGVETTASPFGKQLPLPGTLANFTNALISEDVYENDADDSSFNSGVVMRGDAKRMGAIPTYVAGVGNTVVPLEVRSLLADPSNGVPAGCSATLNNIPRCYVGAIIMPPAKLNKLYYRMKVTWTIEFSGVRSTADLCNWSGLAGLGFATYGTDYAEQSKLMETKTELVDATGAAVNKVMESNR